MMMVGGFPVLYTSLLRCENEKRGEGGLKIEGRMLVEGAKTRLDENHSL